MRPCSNNHIVSLFVALCCPAVVIAQADSARIKIQHIIERAGCKVGVAIIGPGNGDTLTFNGDGHFPMQSVYKFPLALAVLDQVDRGKFSLHQRVHVKKSDLLTRTWSPLKVKYPRGDVDITLDELLAFTVSQSDNNGCDILFRLLGGPDTADRYIHSLGIADISIAATEEEMHKAWEVQYLNWCSPAAMARLLYRFSHDSILSPTSREYLWHLMVATSTGPARLKGQLPEGTIVAHKTGSSGTGNNGIAPATNDVGVVVLPDGRRFVIVVYVSDSTAEENARDAIIAEIARAAWDALVAH